MPSSGVKVYMQVALMYKINISLGKKKNKHFPPQKKKKNPHDASLIF